MIRKPNSQILQLCLKSNRIQINDPKLVKETHFKFVVTIYIYIQSYRIDDGKSSVIFHAKNAREHLAMVQVAREWFLYVFRFIGYDSGTLEMEKN